jgi:ABC-type Fe3+/spermidine/putrescine transport system ATPase subunit
MLLGIEQPSRGELLIDGKPISLNPPGSRHVFQRYSCFHT